MKNELSITNEEKIRGVIEKAADALRNKNVSGVDANFADSAVLFLLAPPLRVAASADSPQTGAISDWFATFDGEIGYEYREMEITAGDSTAFCHSLNRLTGNRTDGSRTDLWFRETLCFTNIEGNWKIVHQHQSVPFYMDGSGNAATDLKP